MSIAATADDTDSATRSRAANPGDERGRADRHPGIAAANATATTVSNHPGPGASAARADDHDGLGIPNVGVETDSNHERGRIHI